MAHDLIFWRELTPRTDSPREVYNRLLADEDVEGLAVLPIDRVKRRFAEAFPGIDDQGAMMSWNGDGSYFQVTWPPSPTNALIVSCGWKLLNSPDTMNRMIDVAHAFGCGLYDPQTGERYEQPAISDG